MKPLINLHRISRAPQTESVPEELQNSTKENEPADIDQGTNSDSHCNQFDEDDIEENLKKFSNDID